MLIGLENGVIVTHVSEGIGWADEPCQTINSLGQKVIHRVEGSFPRLGHRVARRL